MAGLSCGIIRVVQQLSDSRLDANESYQLKLIVCDT